SNRHLNLEPVLGNLAAAVDPPLVGIVQHDGREEEYPGKAASTWVMLARSMSDFGDLPKQKDRKDRPIWTALEGDPKVGVWTDGYSNVLSVFDWGLWKK